MEKPVKTTLEEKKDKFIQNSLTTAHSYLWNSVAPSWDLSDSFQEKVRNVLFENYKNVFASNKKDKELYNEFYIQFEVLIRPEFNLVHSKKVQEEVNEDRFHFLSDFTKKSFKSAFVKTKEAKSLVSLIMNWNLLIGNLTNLINQIDFYGFDLSAKFKKKLFKKSVKKPKGKFSKGEWMSMIMLKLLGLFIEKLKFNNFAKEATTGLFKNLSFFALTGLLGSRMTSLIPSMNSTKTVMAVSFLGTMLGVVNKVAGNKIVEKINIEEMKIYTGVVSKVLLEINTYLNDLTTNLEQDLDNYHIWLQRGDLVKSNECLLKLGRRLEFFIVNESFDINKYQAQLDEEKISFKQYGNEWIDVIEED